MAKSIDTSAITKHYQREFERLHGNSNGSLTAWRRAALDQFSASGLPSSKQEDWRNLNLGPISGEYFVATPAPELDLFNNLDFKYLPRTPRLVFVNGYFTAELSDLSQLSDEVKINSLTYLLKTDPKQVAKAVLGNTPESTNPFDRLNAAFFNSGVKIDLPARLIDPVTIQLIFITRPTSDNQVFHLRNLINIGSGSQLNLVEQYIGLGELNYFNNVVTDVVVEENGGFECTKIQAETPSGNQLSNTILNQQTDSRSKSLTVSMSGKLVRNNLLLALRGEGAHGDLNGLYLGRHNNVIDNHTLIDHIVPNCTSAELYKGILDENAQAIFNGKIIVQPDAQKTNANQINRNLLLSDKARVHTNPQLEIDADDVKCSHGSTTGELDSDTLFYLRSRGISTAEAQALMVNGFANEVLETISDDATRELVINMVSDWFINKSEIS
ncbi:MAG: Fe-S cluster assembly protein SufD [Candidatus Marinimicrobia bacterium]|nr:Fe-S cluster assembly protein SufD [Candidatus Neomarinimicrobiota bacterium]